MATPKKGMFKRKPSTTLPEFTDVVLDEEYDVIKNLGTGRFSYITLVEDKRMDNKILTLKQFQKSSVNKMDFIREYNYSLYLSPHPNFIVTYQGVYCTPETYFFAQEFLPYGSVRDIVNKSVTGLPEQTAKNLIYQVTLALQFLHKEGLVHRNLQAKNVLIYDEALKRAKLTDLGLTKREGTMVKHFEENHEYHAPELCDCLMKEKYSVDAAIDVWAFGILVYFVLQGRYPWDKATILCRPYWKWDEYMKGNTPQPPRKWGVFSDPFIKLFRKTLRPSWKDRCDMKDVNKYFSVQWMRDSTTVTHSPIEEKPGFSGWLDRLLGSSS